MNKLMTPFWLVWNPNANAPSLKHDTKISATAEAERLARKHPGEKFYVLAPICEITKRDIDVVVFNDNGLSF